MSSDFKNMEQVLCAINSKYISLSENEQARNNRILNRVLDLIIPAIKGIDPLFKLLFREIFFGGSYYDGLRVGQPNEFDLDLLLAIEKIAETKLLTCSIPGFINLKVIKLTYKDSPEIRQFTKFLDTQYFIQTQKVINWLQSIIYKCLNQLNYFICNDGRFRLTCSLHGPAVTLHVFSTNLNGDFYPKDKLFTIDLVPSFCFTSDKCPYAGLTSYSTFNKFFVVPKTPGAHFVCTTNDQLGRYWRLSFQAQERTLMENKKNLKPTIKLLKLLRDRYNDKCVASYYIKTIVLNLVKDGNNIVWNRSLSEAFLFALKAYRDVIKKGEIEYFWNGNYKFLKNEVHPETLVNIANRLTGMIKNVENNCQSNPQIVAQYLLSEEQLMHLTAVTENPEASTNCTIL